jgi:hypothetical protein
MGIVMTSICRKPACQRATAFAVVAAIALTGICAGFSADTQAAAKRKAKQRPDPFAGCYPHADRPYNFGFYSTAPLDYALGPPPSSPYTPVPSCRVVSRAAGDVPANRIDDSRLFRFTNARVGVLRLRPELRDPVHDAWPLYDSLGKVTAWIRAVPQRYDRTLWEIWSKDWGGPATGGGTLLATRNMSPGVAPFKVQGRACMTSRTLVQTHYAIQFPNLRSALPGLETSDIGRPSAWGFVDAAALDFSEVTSGELSKLARARAYDDVLTSCGRRHPLTSKKARSAPFKLSVTPFAIPRHHFLGGTSWKRCNPDDPAGQIGEDGQCGTFGQYWAVPGTGLRVVASSTTGVAGGGLPLALIPHYLRFRAIRHVNYCDRNVPRVQTVSDTFAVRGRVWDGSTQVAAWNRGANAFWVYGKFWVGGAARYVYGWAPEPCERLPELRAAFAQLAKRNVRKG